MQLITIPRWPWLPQSSKEDWTRRKDVVSRQKSGSQIKKGKGNRRWTKRRYLKGKKSHTKAEQRCNKAVVINAEVAASLDRSQMSNREAMAVLVPFASGLGSSVEELGLSASIIYRHRRIHREVKATEIKVSFSPSGLLGWEVDASTNERRSCGSPSHSCFCGKSLQAACCPSHRWQRNLQDRIAVPCFDTTATNTGLISGVCLRLQQIFGCALLESGLPASCFWAFPGSGLLRIGSGGVTDPCHHDFFSNLKSFGPLSQQTIGR